MSVTHFWCQLPTNLYILYLRPNMGSLRSVRLPVTCTASYRKKEKFQRAACRTMAGIHEAQLLEVPCNLVRTVSTWYPGVSGSWESRELLFEERVKTGCQKDPWGLRELYFVNCCHLVWCRPRVELPLPCLSNRWKWACPSADVWHATRRSIGQKLGEELWDGSLQSRIPINCAEAEGVVFNEEPSSKGEDPDLLLSTGWFLCSGRLHKISIVCNHVGYSF